MTIRLPRVRPGKFVFVDAKRLLQQYPPKPDIEDANHAGEVQIKKPPEGGCQIQT
jgi:hypothetical protein